MKIHKRFEFCVDVGEQTRCGLFVDYLNDLQLAWRWNKVTCKNCLKHKR